MIKKHKSLFVSYKQAFNFLVARGGIEPPTS